MKAVYNLCGLNIGVSTLYEDTHRYMADYLASKDDLTSGIEFFVETTQEDIDYEKKMSDETHRNEERPPRFSDGYLEELAVQGENKNRVPVSFESDGVRCHLSGAEAQLMRMIEAGEPRENVAAEVYGVLCRTVLRLAQSAADVSNAKEVLIAGGVASSRLLRTMLLERNDRRRAGLVLYFGRPEFSGDNAVGVALIGLERRAKGESHGTQEGI